MAEWGSVVDIVELRRINPKGEIENWYRYRVQTKGGVTFTVTVPEADTAVERLTSILRGKAEAFDATLKI